MHEFSFDHLDATQFENFGYDLLQELGFLNVDWRKGTGKNTSPADSGRDIEAQLERVEIDEAKLLEKWFVDCKHFKQGVPPTELQNLLAWAEAEVPAIALFMVSNFLSNPAKDYLEEYRRNRRPPFRIKVWEKPKLERWVFAKEQLLRKYGLPQPQEEPREQAAALLLGAFMQAWLDLELNSVAAVAARMKSVGLGRRQPLFWHLEVLAQFRILSPYVLGDIDDLRRIRNRIIHGEVDHQQILTDALVERTLRLASEMARLMPEAPPPNPPA